MFSFRLWPNLTFRIMTLIQYGNLSIEMGLASHSIAVLKELPSWLMEVPEIRFLFGISSLCAGRY